MVSKDTSVRGALRRIIMLTTITALVLACGAFVAADLFAFRRALQRDLMLLGDVIAANSTAALTFGDAASARNTLHALDARPSIVAASIYSSNGRPFAQWRARGTEITPPRMAPPVGAPMSLSEIEVVRPIVFDGDTIGTIYIASDLRDLYASSASFIIVTVGVLLLAIVTAFKVSRVLERRFTDPILLDELHHHRDDLQKQVAAKTWELRSANAELVESKDAAERIAEVNENLSRHRQAILDAAAEGIFGLDANGTATFVNMAAASLLGDYAGNLIGRHLHDVLHPRADAHAEWQECDVCSPYLDPPLRAGRTTMFVSRDGRAFPVEYTTSTMHTQGVGGVVVTFRDITERLAVERMKDEFVSTVSHELRTPLTSIRGALGLLDSGMVGPVGERAKRMLGIALANTDRLVRMINDILDIERMRSGKVELNRKVTSAEDLGAEAIEVVQTFAERASIALECDVEHALLWVDRDRIVQTLTNLLGNAIKFSPAGSTVHLRGAMSGDAFRYTVRDRGRGIPSEKIETVFERFQQVDASDSRDRGGSGLGLAISRSIVSAHGGRIWAESVLGEGSSFHLTVPCAVRRPSLPGAIAAGAVLVCGDDAATADSIVHMLESRGHRAFLVSDIASLIEQARGVPPVAIFITCERGTCGVVVETLRESLAGMPLVMVSDQPPSLDPITAWVRKPFAGADLVSALAITTKSSQEDVNLSSPQRGGMTGDPRSLRDRG